MLRQGSAVAESVLFGRKSEGFRIELQICRDGACGRERGRVENGYAEMLRSGGAKSGYADMRRCRGAEERKGGRADPREGDEKWSQRCFKWLLFQRVSSIVIIGNNKRGACMSRLRSDRSVRTHKT